MKRLLPLLALPFVAWSLAQDAKLPDTVVPAPNEAPTKAGSYNWMARHEGALRRVQKGKVDLILVGDSITHGWGGEPTEEASNAAGTALFEKYFGDRNTVNLGFGWDGTQHVLWRLEHGEVDGISPKAAVVMIGTNNVGYPAKDIALGVEAVVKKLRQKLPETKVLLLAIFPCGQFANSPNRLKIAEANQMIAPLGKLPGVTFLDIGPKFLSPDGSISKEIMPDFLHPTPKGYEIWAKGMEPTLAKLLGEKPRS